MRSVLTLFFVLSCGVISAQDYVSTGGVLYQKYSVPYTYYYCGRPYTSYKYEYRAIVNSNKAGWKEEVIKYLDKQKEREEFDKIVGMLGASQSYGNGVQYNGVPQAALYPSATGNTLGAFSSYEYQRYGTVSPYDTNKAQEFISRTTDELIRIKAESEKREDENFSALGGLIQQNAQSVGAAVEWQEARQTLKELRGMIKESGEAQASILRELKPQYRESIKIEQNAEIGGQQAPSGGPVGLAPITEEARSIVTKYCAACHGKDKTDPDGGFYVDLDTPITKEQFANISIRLDEATSEKSEAGKPLKMPPKNSPQPTEEERIKIERAFKSLILR